MINVRFLGAQGNYQSIETQALRICKELERVGAGRVSTHLSLESQDFFRRSRVFKRPPWRKMAALVEGMDLVVVVKSSLFREFVPVAARFRDMCHSVGAVLVSNPCDGPGADGGDTSDPFSESIADFALAISRRQRDDLATRRPPEEVLLVEHASRLERPARVPVRDTVCRVLWENPVHHNPRYDPRKAGGSRESLQALEDMIKETLQARGAELVFIEAWRETQSYEDWEQVMLDADIAIECKALGQEYVPYQLQKPMVKVVNYLSLGLPVICDSVPSYRDLGEDGKELLFADTLPEWKEKLTRILDDAALRERLSDAGWKAAQPYQIDAVCERYMRFFDQMLETRGLARSTRPCVATSERDAG